MNTDIESCISAASRAQQADDAQLGNCSRIWHVGFFFDGIHRNIEQDAPEHRLSNIARLFRAFPDDTQNLGTDCYSKFYISGLGTAFQETLTTKLHTIMDGAMASVLDDLKNQPAEMAKEAGGELLSGGNWYEILNNQGDKLINPHEWKKLAKGASVSAAIRAAIEATPWVRDNPTVADMLVTGVDTRISSSKITFEEAFKESKNKSQVPIKLISISLFGFDLGATLARKFIDSLLADICQKTGDKYTYQGIPVDILFTGLFDCSRRTPASNNNGVDYFVSVFGGPVSGVSVLLGDKSIDQESVLHPAVKNSLHLVAAHETRVWRSLYRTGVSGGNHQEVLMPGCAEDIGSGLRPNEQKPSAELCRVALHKMYREAAMAGVPFPDFQSLYASNPVIASYFTMEDSVNHKSVAQWARQYQGAVPASTLSVSAQNRHLDSYIDWLGRQYYQYRSECLKYEKQRGEVLTSAGASAGMLGITPQARHAASGIQNELDILHQHWGWLGDVHDAAKSLQNNKQNDLRLRIQPEVYGPADRRAKRFLEYAHAAYLGEAQPFPIDNAPSEMYAWFVHDLQTVEKGATISQDFLVIRSMEMPTA